MFVVQFTAYISREMCYCESKYKVNKVLLHKWEKDKKLNINIKSDETGTLYVSIYIHILFLKKLNHI